MAWTVLMNAIVYNLLVRTIGEVGLFEYVIGRRALSFITVLLFLGVGVALPRQLAMSKERGSAELGYVLGAAVLISPGSPNRYRENRPGRKPIATDVRKRPGMIKTAAPRT